jgi:hypothetical protein
MAPESARREELTRLVMAAQPTPFWLDRPDALAARDRKSGRRNLWLRALDAAGMGYDS